jgi:hypothetical protein
MISVTGVQCLRCKSIIVSRAGHDFHYCPCKTVFVDGGRSYLRVGYKTQGDIQHVRIDIPQISSVQDLEDDYRHGHDKFGTFEPETHAFLNVRDATDEDLEKP